MSHAERRVKYEVLLLVHLGLRPRDVDGLTVAEFERFCVAADDMNRRQSGEGPA